jgi:hypothetical protein
VPGAETRAAIKGIHQFSEFQSVVPFLFLTFQASKSARLSP